MTWCLCLVVAIAAVGYVLLKDIHVSAGDTPLTSDGVMFYGDVTNAGVMKARTFTSTATWAGEYSGITGSASNILHVTAKTAPVREEIMIGNLKVDGRLDISTCTTECNANADHTARWNATFVSATQDCDTTPTIGTCIKPFDIGYQQLNNRAMVVYAGDSDANSTTDTDVVYYAEWDGSAWSPDASPGSPSTSNDLDLPGTALTPRWIRVVPAGENLADDRSNRLMVLIADSDNDLYAFYWDGSSFDGGTELFTSLGNCDRSRCFDGNWQGNNTFIVTYTQSGGNLVRYQKFTVGGGWEGDSAQYTGSSAGAWITSRADPTSSRIYVASAAIGEDTRGSVWRADNATDGWTVCAAANPNCPDTAIETVGPQQSTVAFERFNGEALHFYNNAGTTNTDQYYTYTPTSTWSTSTAGPMTADDDALGIWSWTNPNNDDIMNALVDIDCDIDAVEWSGGGFGASTEIETSSSVHNNSGTACTAGAPVDGMAAQPLDFAWKMYTAWQRNWRFYADDTSNQTPSTALAAENTAPSAVTHGDNIRLRINYADRGRSISNTDARKKLQYTVGCNPNSTLESDCNWVDVDDPGGNGVWRYTASASCGTCTDNTAIPSTLLTGSSSCASAGQGCGTFTLDKDSATVSNMDHNVSASADIVQEAEYIIESIGAAANTTYYFRVWNVDQQTPVYREQDTSDCGGGAAQCTYPSLTTGAGPANTDTLRHGNWWSSGGEQTYFWVFFTVPTTLLRTVDIRRVLLTRFKA